MNVYAKNPTTRQARFTWSCSRAPIGFLVVFATLAFHIRLGLGYWPDQSIKRFPDLILRVHSWVFIGTILFSFFIAPIHLVVTGIHFRQIGMRLGQLITCGFLYLGGAMAFFLVMAYSPAWFVTWFTD